MLFELFSDIFTIRENRLTALDPRVKLAAVLFVVILILVSPAPIFPLLIFAASVTAALWISVPLKHLAIRFAAPAGIAGMLLILKAFMTTGDPLYTLRLFGHSFAATAEGLSSGFLLSSRIMGAVAVLQLFSYVTPAHKVFQAMLWMGAPKGWVEVAMMMYRFSFDMFEKAADISMAQKTRLGYSTVATSLSSAGTLAGAVALGAMDKAARVEEAMRARGYKGDIPIDKLPALAPVVISRTAGGFAGLFVIFIAVY